MPTVTKTWSFLTDAEGLTDAGSHPAIHFAWESGDGSPASGCVRFTCTTANVNASEYGRRASTGETWETWGVPAGATVTHLQITAWRTRKYSVATNDGATIYLRVINSTGGVVHSASPYLATQHISTPPPGGWVDEMSVSPEEIQYAVDSPYQASTTDVRLEIEALVGTGTFFGNLDVRIDTISLSITYVEGVTPPSATSTLAWAYAI